MSRRPAAALPATPDAISRVEAAMEAMRAELGPLLAAEAERLRAVSELAARDPRAARAAVPDIVHDLKGLGATCDRPLVSRTAAAFERRLAGEAEWGPTLAVFVEALLALSRADDSAPTGDDGERLVLALERLAAG